MKTKVEIEMEITPEIIDAIAEKLISSGDYVPVVRCKDCKHYQFTYNRAFGFPVKICGWTGFEDVDDDDFCSRGETKRWMI